MITKKDIPFDLLKAIEVIAQSNLDIIQLKREDNTYYCFIENDNKSNNFFRIYIDGTARVLNYDKKKFACEYKPGSTSNTINHVIQGNSQEVAATFEKWVKIVREIHDTPSVHDDNFVKQYSDFYYNEFKILDKDAETSPFNPDQQELVELYLDSLTKAIESSNDKLDLFIKEELISLINETKLSLTTTTKNQVMKGITKVFGKLFKASKPIAKEIVIEAKKQLIKKLVGLGIEYGPKIFEMLT